MLTGDPSFGASARIERDCAVLTFEGELDLGVKERARVALEDACQAHVVVVDLRELTFMDTTGVHLLMDARDRCRASGRRLLVVRGQESVHRAFAALELERELEFVDEPFAT